APFVDVRFVPTLCAVISRIRRALRQRRDLRIESGVEEERKRQSAFTASVLHAVRRRTIKSARQPIEHVADVADQRSFDGRRSNPSVRCLDLQPAIFVLSQEREQPVIGVFAYAPGRVFRGRGWVLKYSKQ